MAAARAQAARSAARPHPPRPAEKPQAPDAGPAPPPDAAHDPAAGDAAPAGGAGSLDEQAQVLLEIERERQAFDAAFALRTELTRELNLLFELALEQRKRDDELTRAGIKLI